MSSEPLNDLLEVTAFVIDGLYRQTHVIAGIGELSIILMLH